MASILPFNNPATSKSTNIPKNDELAFEIKFDSNQIDRQNNFSEAINLFGTSLALSIFSPVKSSDKAGPIENRIQAQQALKQLIADFQSNPSQAFVAHSNVFSSTIDYQPLL